MIIIQEQCSHSIREYTLPIWESQYFLKAVLRIVLRNSVSKLSKQALDCTTMADITISITPFP